MDDDEFEAEREDALQRVRRRVATPLRSIMFFVGVALGICALAFTFNQEEYWYLVLLLASGAVVFIGWAIYDAYHEDSWPFG